MLTDQLSVNSTATVQQQSNRQQNSILHQIVSFQNSFGPHEHRKDRRINGLKLPLHPFQLIGWITIIIFILAAYFVILPTFHPVIKLPFFVLISILVAIHIISHIAALSIDPADIELRKASIRKVVPEFDRSKHSHVIENGRCHLCNIKTSSHLSKHCSVSS